MWWRNLRQWQALAWPARLAVVLAAAGLTAGCWQPLYGARPGPGGEGVQDKFAAVDIPPIAAPKGTPTERVAIGMRNALQFDLHNGGSPMRRRSMRSRSLSALRNLPPTSIPPPAARTPRSRSSSPRYQLIELGTGKMVLNDMTIAHVDYDIPGSQQRFAGQRARRDAEDRAIQVVADAIRNRLASYFVAGT